MEPYFSEEIEKRSSVFQESADIVEISVQTNTRINLTDPDTEETK